jgi:RNA polymerase sigma-70 factor, ECF subfamily
MPIFRKNRNYHNNTDEELLALYLKEGDMEAYGELFGRYMLQIYGICLSVLKDRDQAKDTVMLLFEKTSADINKFQVHSFKSWIYVVAKNQCLMELRKKKPEISLKNEIAWQFMENQAEMHPLDDDNQDMNDAALQNCIDKLTENQRRCIELFYFSGKCYREISALLETDEKAVKSFIQNGKRNLKICLENRK